MRKPARVLVVTVALALIAPRLTTDAQQPAKAPEP